MMIQGSRQNYDDSPEDFLIGTWFSNKQKRIFGRQTLHLTSLVCRWSTIQNTWQICTNHHAKINVPRKSKYFPLLWSLYYIWLYWRWHIYIFRIMVLHQNNWYCRMALSRWEPLGPLSLALSRWYCRWNQWLGCGFSWFLGITTVYLEYMI